MKHNFYIIGKELTYHPDGSIAADFYGEEETVPLVVRIEAETYEEALDISSEIAEEIGHNWKEFSTYSEAERMWNNGHPAFFNMDALKGIKRLKGVVL